MIDIQYDSIIMGGRDVSRPYRVGFSPKASGFILGAMWKALVRGWRRDCVVGGMETRFQ